MMFRFFLITILLMEYTKLELKAEAAPSLGTKELEKESNEEKELDQLKQSQENAWNAQSSVHKMNKDPPELKKKERDLLILNEQNRWNGHLAQKQLNHKRVKFSGVRYSAKDFAEYIIRTGDEEGVVSAVRDLLRSKTLNRHDAVSFLQEVKEAISELKTIPRTEESEKNSVKYFMKRQNKELLKEAQQKETQRLDRNAITTESPLTTALLFAEERSLGVDQSSDHVSANHSKKHIKHAIPADLQNEKIMRKVIYRLAKEMFLHSLESGEKGAKRTITRLLTILEKDIHNKMVPHKVKEIILESVSAALLDSLKAYSGTFPQQYGVKNPHLRQRRSSLIRATKV